MFKSGFRPILNPNLKFSSSLANGGFLHWFAEQHSRQHTTSLRAANFDKREGEKRGKASPPPDWPAAGASPRRCFVTEREKARLSWPQNSRFGQLELMYLTRSTHADGSTPDLVSSPLIREAGFVLLTATTRIQSDWRPQHSPACFTRCRTDRSVVDVTPSMAEEAIPDADGCGESSFPSFSIFPVTVPAASWLFIWAKEFGGNSSMLIRHIA
nr:hypothetical protein Iba_chr01fCG8430 [Ipomoea batatas]